MNVLFISNDPSIFDPQSSTRARMRAYAQEIGTLHIISRAQGTSSVIHEDLSSGASLILHPIDSKTSKVRKPFLFFALVQESRKIIKDASIEIVSAQDPFEYGWVAMKAVRGQVVNGKKVLLHVQLHTDPFSPWFTRIQSVRLAHICMQLINRIRQSIADNVLPKADGIRVVSERVQSSLIARYGNRIHMPTIIPVVVSAAIPPAVPLPSHRFTFALMTVGRLEAEKRIEDILTALAQVRLQYPDVGLIIVGEGRMRRSLENQAQKLGLNDSVVFLGQRTDAWGLLQSVQAYIQASGYEGYGRTLLEAALARLPIITTDVGIVGEVFRNEQEVLVAGTGDPMSLAERIIELMQNSQERRELGLAAEKAAHEHLASVHTGPVDIAEDLRKLL